MYKRQLEASAVAVPADNDAKITDSRSINRRLEMSGETGDAQAAPQGNATATMGDVQVRSAPSVQTTGVDSGDEARKRLGEFMD